jgi:hypothetical protein
MLKYFEFHKFDTGCFNGVLIIVGNPEGRHICLELHWH